ncbi:MAG: 50S ribosomal protein L6, partial [Chitinivibrionales bacterium]|nr:50S ribosomal protein L6 [Chitinivibrionales bacterium]
CKEHNRLSRIGKKAVALPKGVEAKIEGQKITVKGPKGSLSRVVPECLKIELAEGAIKLSPAAQPEDLFAQWGLYRMLIDNMVVGVLTGYRKTLDITGVGYKAEVKGKNLVVTVGYSHSVSIPAVDGVKVVAETPTLISIEGIDKALVGQIAAEIRSIKEPEPYKGKGIKYTDERIRKKVGKTAGK